MNFKVIVLLIFSLSAISVESTDSNQCLGLVLKGGANRGAYEAGAIAAFVKLLDPEEVKWDVISGVSVGALSASFISLYDKGDEQQMSLDLLQLWRDLKKENLYENWWGGFITGLLFKKGLFNQQPLVDFVRKQIGDRPKKRMLSFTAVDANTGALIAFDETIEGEDFIKALIGSTAMPFVFPSVPFYDKILIDGGSAWNLDVASAIRRCREVVDEDSQIVLDIIDVGYNQTLLPPASQSMNAIRNYLRAREIKNYHSRMDDFIEIKRAFPEVQFRYFVIPQKALESETKILSLDPPFIEQLIERGIEDATEAILKHKQ